MSAKQRLTLVATILGSTIVFLDATVVNVALPAIEDDLDTGLAGQQWVVEAYLLTLVALLLVGGSLGDLYGRRRLFTLGLTGFAITSILCAIAPTDETLIGARALQGITGALLVPGSLAILAATFEGEARGRAVGIWTAWSGISTLIGPAGGGLLVELDWRLIFWLNVPIVLAAIWVTRRAVDESSDPEAVHGIDGPGIALSALGLALPVFALVEQPTRGFADPLVWVPLVGGVALLVAFVIWEARARAPMLPLELFRSHNFSSVNLATLLVYAALYGAFFFITLFLQQVAGFSPFAAGAATTPVTVVMFLLSGRFGALAARVGPRLLMTAGPLLAAAGLLLLLGMDSDVSYATELLPAMLVFGLGLAMTVAPLTTTVLNSVEERRAGVASGTNNAVARVAGVLAIAALGAVVSAQFASALDDRLAGQSLSAAASQAVDDAKEQPLSGGDVGDLRGPEADTLGADMVAASESGFHLGMAIGAGLLALGALVALTGVRNPERTDERSPGYARIPFPRRRLGVGPLDPTTRFLIAINRAALGQLWTRAVRRLRPTSRLRRYLFRGAVTLAMKAVLARDRRALSAFYEPDAEIIVPRWPGLAERYVGADGFMDFFDAWTENWDQVELEVAEAVDLGETSLVLGWMHTRGGASGVATRHGYSSYQQYGATRIARGEWFLTWEEGMAAAGLEDEPLPE